MHLHYHLLLFLLIFGLESWQVTLKHGNSAPHISDAAVDHNIAYSLAHGRGYSVDWDDEQWRGLWQAQNGDGRFDSFLALRGQHPTMSRPPLKPLLVGGILLVFPERSFLAWRLFDSAAFAAAACLLCEVAFVQGGMIGFVGLMVMLILDPLRRHYVPGWWTEGLAFDFLSVMVWLMANGGRLRRGRYNVYAGLAIGLLCLDRAMFILAMPLTCLTLAIARSTPRTLIIRNAAIILAVSMSIQMPWWVRNTIVSGRLLPLGTQGGFNLPDQYGDVAIRTGGLWTGRGIRDAWTQSSDANLPMRIPPGLSRESLDKLDKLNPSAHQFAAVIYAVYCNSIQSEIALSDAGQRSAVAWLRANYTQLPRLMALKVYSLTTSSGEPYLAIPVLLAAILFCASFTLKELRRTSSCLAMLIASYVLAVALTHVVYYRFLLPILPAGYVGVASGIAAIEIGYRAHRRRHLPVLRLKLRFRSLYPQSPQPQRDFGCTSPKIAQAYASLAAVPSAPEDFTPKNEGPAASMVAETGSHTHRSKGAGQRTAAAAVGGQAVDQPASLG
jgi:hypothetical protein